MAVLNFKTPSAFDTSFLKWVKASAPRKRAANERLSLYLDEQSEDTMRLIAEKWQPDALKSFRAVSVNIVRKIADKRATVYKRAPRRSFEGWDQDKGEALYSAIGANVILKKANCMTGLFKTAMLQVIWNDAKAAPRLCILTPNILDVEHNGFPEDPIRVAITNAASKETEVTYSDWTADGYSRKDYRGYPIANDGNPGNVNPYGILPFIPLFDRFPESDFFLKGGQDIVDAQRAVNVALSNIWRATELQAHGQPVTTGVSESDAFSGQYNLTGGGPTRAITLPVGADFKYAAPDAPVEEMLRAVEFLIKQTAVANDLAANVFELDSKAESGAAKIADSRDLIESRADDLDLWRRYEAQLFDVIKVVSNVNVPGSIPETARLTVDFAEIDETASDSDRLQSYRDRLDMGLWSQVDALLADNPDIRTREDALRTLQERREEASLLGQTFSGPSFGAIQ